MFSAAGIDPDGVYIEPATGHGMVMSLLGAMLMMIALTPTKFPSVPRAIIAPHLLEKPG